MSGMDVGPQSEGLLKMTWKESDSSCALTSCVRRSWLGLGFKGLVL